MTRSGDIRIPGGIALFGTLSKFWRDEDGKVTVEYAMLMSAMVLPCCSAWHQLSLDIQAVVLAAARALELR